jgi:hypothetical protein
MRNSATISSGGLANVIQHSSTPKKLHGVVLSTLSAAFCA